MQRRQSPALKDTGIAEQEYLLRKPVNTLAIVPKSEKITVTARKIYNVMLQFAQRQGVDKDRYQARLSEITIGIDFNSHNTELIKQYFRQMATTGVEWQSPTTGEGARWSVSALIAHADLIQRGNELILEWSYAPNIKREVLDPQRFAKMSLQILASLNTMASVVLYEICCRYADNPSGLTARQPWGWWRPVLTGAPDSPTSAYQEYKIFNRDVLKKAVKRVNEATDLDVELIEHRAGRSVQELQFKVQRKQPALLQPDRAIEPVDLKSIGALIKAGIPQERAEKLLVKYGQSAIDRALDLLEGRLKRHSMEPVRSVEKYLVSILQSGQLVQQNEPSPPTVTHVFDTKSERIKLIEIFVSRKRGELEEMFREMSDAERANWTTRFAEEGLATSGPLRKAFATKGVLTQLVKPAFLKFLGNEVWEAGWEKPTDAELLDIAIMTRNESTPARRDVRNTSAKI